MADYRTYYSYTINNKKTVFNTNQACFGDLFRSMSISNSGSVVVYMYKKLSVSHDLSFSEDDIKYVFDKLSDVIDIPEINTIKNGDNKKGLSLEFKFENKSKAYIKILVTLSRYFYEMYGDSTKRDLNIIMRDAIKYSMENSDCPFIEALQLFHYDSTTNGGHTLVSVYSREYPICILSHKTFKNRMDDLENCGVYDIGKSVFSIFRHDEFKEGEAVFLSKLTEIKRI